MLTKLSVENVQIEAARCAKEKGWDESPLHSGNGKLYTDAVARALCLVHSEVSEALEELRKATCLDDLRTIDFETVGGKPVGFPTEIADAIIRLLHMCEQLGIDAASAIAVKQNYNKTRPYRHGGKSI